MLKFLIEMLDHQMSVCKRATEFVAKKCFYDQAFGMVQYHIALFPSDHDAVESLWNDYRVRFEEVVWG